MTETLDLRLLAWAGEWQHPALTAGMQAVTWLGSVVFLLPLALVLGWQRHGRHDWRRWGFLPAAVLGGALIAQAIKWSIDRDRPELLPSLVAVPADPSFPSAHAWQITAFVAAWLLSTDGLRRHGQVMAGIMLVLLIGFSRLYLQVHFPSDVLCGMLGGLLWVWLLQRLPLWRAA